MLNKPLILPAAHTLQSHYSDFQVDDRILLSGHSHQAWPNVAKQGLLQSFNDAALHIDDKWQAAFEKAERVKHFYANLLGESDGEITLGASTHELILRFLSDLPQLKTHKLHRQIKIITTDGEFHSMRRQLDRLKDINCIIEKVPVSPSSTLATRIIEKLDTTTDAVMLSAVFFSSSEIFNDIGQVAKAANDLSIPCLIDAYHALNVIPFNLNDWQVDSAFIIGGGYKYCQAGEGNCFMRLPKNYHGSPLITGWFAEFDSLNKHASSVGYGQGHHAFSGSTYDPASHYRAAAVFDFFDEHRLTDVTLHQINHAQIKTLYTGIKSIKLNANLLSLPQHSIENNAGFLSLTSPQAHIWVKELAKHNILCDSRGNQLRLGPAPYVSNPQLETTLEAIEHIGNNIQSDSVNKEDIKQSA
ncbi:aminotransferase class V-fold PLP-dependent enzyme [uncultured Shewanella sp.]|uniref:aminotransferase class V-fold PLP-dependent enzyme n=1 Tax=uncultured Shewanella sp. TaxID=173975 RepID=UPI0026387C71|nr:aminotransferase class V-fold PLP-dependent enzyme [uncultured Shewanella sp.]